MLDQLFISRVRVKILDLYTRDMDASFHVRGLVRELDEEINAVRRELKNLKEAEILNSEKQGNKIVYTLNKKSLYIPELRKLFRKDLPSVIKIHDALIDYEGITFAMLTNKYFTKDYTTKNDIDLLIVGEVELNDLSNKISHLEKEFSRTLKVSVLKSEEFDFRKRNRDSFLMNAFKEDKVIVIGDETQLFV